MSLSSFVRSNCIKIYLKGVRDDMAEYKKQAALLLSGVDDEKTKLQEGVIAQIRAYEEIIETLERLLQKRR